MSQIYEEDVLKAGKKQIIISNDKTKVVIVPELGGRIVDVLSGEIGFMYRTYPNGVNFGPYTEYGGIEECIGGAPGTLWNAEWKWEQKDNGILLQTFSRGILVRKFISLDSKEPIVKIDYSFFNFGNTFSKFTFGIHPEICIGGSLRDNRYCVPSGEGLSVGGYAGSGVKRNITPSEGWCAVTYEGKVFGQMFPENVVDTVEIYYPRIDSHVVLQPMIFGVGVSPDKYAEFTYMIYAGDGDAEKVREIQILRKAEFSVKYELFDRAEFPESIIADMEKAVRFEAKDIFLDVALRDQGIQVRPELFQIPEVPQIKEPADTISDLIVRLRSEKLRTLEELKKRLGMVPKKVRQAEAIVNFVPLYISETGKDELFGRTINIEHVKGDIVIRGWEKPNIGFTINGIAKQGEDAVNFETTGSFSLNVPREVSQINLNFVNSNVVVSDINSSLKVSGVGGKIEIDSKIPDDGVFDISLITGGIDLRIPESSLCSISAINSSGGGISCDLPLQEEERTRFQLNGILNAGTAKILLNTVKGRISISRSIIEK